jgi:hypothetical protein
VLALEPLASPELIDCPVLRRGHQPRAWIPRDAGLRPLLERGNERVVGEVLRESYVADDSREAGNEPGRLDSPDRVDRAMNIGSRHGYRSHHLAFDRRKPYGTAKQILSTSQGSSPRITGYQDRALGWSL